VLDGKKEELSLSRTELGDMGIDDELLLALDDDDDDDNISVSLDTEEDILLQIDDAINDTSSWISNGCTSKVQKSHAHYSF
jgi:hypothetical protein